MANEIEIAVKGESAQDLYFIAREVPGTKVIEESSDDSGARFGMPGLIEAVVVVSAISAAVGVILHIAKTRKTCEVIVRQKTSNDGSEFKEVVITIDQEESPDALLNKIDKLIGAFGTIPAS